MVKTIPSLGTGRPDYSANINNIIRGRIIKDYQPLYYEKMKILALTNEPGAVSAYPWVSNTLLSPGATASLVDTETGLTEMLIPRGYDIKITNIYFSSTQPIQKYSYVDGELIGTAHNVDFGFLQSQELGISFILPSDPYFQKSHVVSVKVKNLGDEGSRTTVIFQFIMRRVGSPEITTKDIRCKNCGYIKKNVPLSLTRWKCDKCGTLNKYYYLPFGDNYG